MVSGVQVTNAGPGISPSAIRVLDIRPAGVSPAASPALPAVAGAQPFVNLLCKFSDMAGEQHAPSWYDALMGIGGNGTTVPTLDNYFRDSSYSNITLAGSFTT